MESAYRFLALRNQASIQTMATILFTFHTLFLLSQMFAILGARDMVVHLMCFSVDASFPEVCFMLIPRIVMLLVTITVDLLLVFGIEDDPPKAMTLFVNWTIADILLDSFLSIILVSLKYNHQNVKTLLGALGVHSAILLVKGMCAYRVQIYNLRCTKGDSTGDSENGAERQSLPALVKALRALESKTSLLGARCRRFIRGPKSDPGDSRTVNDLQ